MGRSNSLTIMMAAAGVVSVSAMFDAHAQAIYTDAEMLVAVWESDPEAIASLLPPPLKPYKHPIVIGFVADFPKTNFGVTYKMAAISIVCEYNGEVGSYCVGMPEDNDIPVFLGRELQGYPKKMGVLSLRREDKQVLGTAERRGVTLFEIKARATGAKGWSEDAASLRELIPDPWKNDAVAFNVWGLRPPGGEAQYTPKLIRQITEFRPYHIEFCDAEVITRESKFDSPWGKLRVVRVLGCMYTKGNNTMRPEKVVADLTWQDYAPFSRMKYDW